MGFIRLRITSKYIILEYGAMEVSASTTKTLQRLVDARNDWWGHILGRGGVGPGSGDEVTASVDYSLWLSEYALPTCTQALSAINRIHSYDSETGSFALLTEPLCPWTAIKRQIMDNGNIRSQWHGRCGCDLSHHV